MKQQTNNEDGYGNEISYKDLDQLKDYFDFRLNDSLWLNGDRIQIHNKEGCVINTIIIKDKRLL